MASEENESSYTGKYANVVELHCQIRCQCGVLFPFTAILSVDAHDNPDLACLATETSKDRAINSYCCPACDRRSLAHIPFTYHNGTEEQFLLVLPESLRHRELEERARLLQELASETVTIPKYVVDCPVVFGAAGLSDYMSDRAREEQELEVADLRMRELSAQGKKAELREQEIHQREEELLANTQRLDMRSSELTERELSLRDRKSALDRRSSELEIKTEKLHQAQLAMRIDTEGEGRAGLPDVLRENSTMALDMEDIMTSASSSDPHRSINLSNSVTGSSSVDKRPVAPTPFDEEDTDLPFTHDSELFATPSRESKSVSNEATRVSAPNPVLLREDASIVPKRPVVLSEFDRWRERDEAGSKLVNDDAVQLRARIDADELGELGGQDLRALLQLHQMSQYPLVTLTLATASTLSGQSGTPFTFHFDVADPKDRDVLDRLADRFSFELFVYDMDYAEIHQRTVAAPLGSNVRYVIALALESLETLDSDGKSLAAAIQTFDDPRYDRLGRRHQFARNFKDSILDNLQSAPDLQKALLLCETFSDAEHEEYLVATRSYPFDRWARRRLRVIGKALKAGLWMGPELAQIAVSEELAGSRKELVSQCQKNFSRFAAMDDCELDADSIAQNWEFLDREAQRLGISEPARIDVGVDLRGSIESTTIPKERQGEEVVLLAALDALEEEAPTSDLSEILSLCAGDDVDSVFRLLTELPQEEAPDGFAAVVGMGAKSAEPLRLLLDCPAQYLKQGAALALCELRDEEGVDSVCEMMIEVEGLVWHELAIALGHVGQSAVMPIVTRIARGNRQTATRGGWALAHISALGGSKPIETLSKSRDSNVATVATAALELGAKLRRGDSTSQKRGTVERAFSTRFYRTRQSKKTSNSELSGPMMLDEGDLMEAVD